MSENTISVTPQDVGVIIDELGGMPLGAGNMIQNSVKMLLENHVGRAIAAFESSNNIEGAQAISQTVAVSAAWVAGTLFGWSTKLPLKGLDVVFQSFKDQGFMGKVLEHLGVESALTRQKILNLSKGLGFGASFAYGVDETINVINASLGTTPDPLVKVIRYVDPLVLDLDGDGLEITPLSQVPRIFFDANGDTIRTQTAWIGKDDGLVVWDRNGNGTIDSGRELFGDETVMVNGQKARHGFEALAELDSNADGKFDSADARFGDLRIWRDTNQDGVSQASEMRTHR